MMCKDEFYVYDMEWIFSEPDLINFIWTAPNPVLDELTAKNRTDKEKLLKVADKDTKYIVSSKLFVDITNLPRFIRIPKEIKDKKSEIESTILPLMGRCSIDFANKPKLRNYKIYHHYEADVPKKNKNTAKYMSMVFDIEWTPTPAEFRKKIIVNNRITKYALDILDFYCGYEYSKNEVSTTDCLMQLYNLFYSGVLDYEDKTKLLNVPSYVLVSNMLKSSEEVKEYITKKFNITLGEFKIKNVECVL